MSKPDDKREGELEPVTFQPLPNIITAFSADASPFEALAESVDNSIDHVRSRAFNGDPPGEDLEITISFDLSGSPEDSRIVIEDNAGGVEGDDLSRFFQWGASVTAPESIGRFGVGASRIAALGERISYQSRSTGQETGYGFEVNVAEMEQHEGEVTEETYRAARSRVEDLQEGHTRIIIKDLKLSFEELFNIEEDESRDAIGKEQWESALEELAGRFGDFFERYISDGISFDAEYFSIPIDSIDASIEVKLETEDISISKDATPPPAIEYSYLPFDSLGPRRYIGLPFDSEGGTPPDEASIRADIEVGLMRNADDNKAGLTLYANDRKILSRDTSNPLFTSDYLGRYRSESGHGRLVIEVELRGEIDEMPINSLKSDLDMNSPVANPLIRITKNAAKRYRKQTYSSLPGWMLSVYDSKSPFAANGGRVEQYDKSDAETNAARFRNQPGSSGGRRMFEERDRLRAIVKVHRALRIYDEGPLLPKEEPAYIEYYDEKYEDEIKDSEFTPKEPTEIPGPDLDWSDISITADEEKIAVIAKIKKLARQHYNFGGRADQTNELQGWQIPRYREELRKLAEQTNLDNTELKEWDTIPKEVLIDALQDLATELEKVPSEMEMEEFGLYKSSLYKEQFGSWEEALGVADLGESSERNGENDKPDDKDSQDSDQSSGEDDVTGSKQGSDEIQRDTVSVSNLDGSGIVVNGQFYRIESEDMDLLREILDLSDDSEPEEAWSELRDVLEWYRQMPS